MGVGGGECPPLCCVPAVPPTLRGIAHPELKKRRRLRLPHGGAKRPTGPRVRVRPPQPPPPLSFSRGGF